jgi:hypothetical protein
MFRCVQLKVLLAQLGEERLRLSSTVRCLLASSSKMNLIIFRLKRVTYFLNRFPLRSLSFFEQGLMISSDGET